MTFLPSKAGGFLFQTALIKRENKNIAGFCGECFGEPAAFSGLVIFTGANERWL